MKKIFYGIFIFIAYLFLIPNAFALDTSLKVYDNAGLLTDSEIAKLKKEINTFIETYDMDMVLVTTNNNYSKDPRGYAEDFYDDNGFGIGNTKDGVIFLIDRTSGYNDIYMATTGEAILIYDDNRIDSILDDIVDQKNNGYYSMFSTFVSSSSKYAAKGVAPSNQDYYIDSDGNYRHKRIFPWMMVIFISLITPSIIVGILVMKNKMIKKATEATVYLDEQSVQYTRKEDKFIHTHTSTLHIPKNTGGSSGGGSSIHTGHSGTSHGGGGRRC